MWVSVCGLDDRFAVINKIHFNHLLSIIVCIWTLKRVCVHARLYVCVVVFVYFIFVCFCVWLRESACVSVCMLVIRERPESKNIGSPPPKRKGRKKMKRKKRR